MTTYYFKVQSHSKTVDGYALGLRFPRLRWTIDRYTREGENTLLFDRTLAWSYEANKMSLQKWMDVLVGEHQERGDTVVILQTGHSFKLTKQGGVK